MDSGARDGCLRGRSQCACLRDCTDITDKQFHKIFELKDTGVALYRYVPLNQDPENTIGEIYVLRTEDDFELEPDQFSLSLAKHKINCPRCIKLIEKAENSLSGRRLIKQQDAAGICDHCWRPVAKMQKLDQKKEKPSATSAVEAIKAQVEQKGEKKDEDKVKKRSRAAKVKDKSKTKAGDEKRLPKIPKKEHKTKTVKEVKKKPLTAKLKDKGKTKVGDEKRSPNIPEKEHETKVPEETGDEKLSPEIPDKADETKLLEEVKTESGTEKLMDMSKIKAEELRRLAKMPEKAKEQIKEKEVKQKSSAIQMKEQLAQEMLKMRKEEENKRREQEQEKKMAEWAEKRARQAELRLQRQVQLIIPPPKLVYHEPDSDEDTPKHTVHKALPVSDIIIGEKICKNTRGDKSVQLDTSKKISTKPLRKSGSTRAVESERKKTPDISKKGPFVDSGKHEKEAAESGSGDKKVALGTEELKKESGLETDSPKTGNATDSETPTKVSVVSAEKLTRKSSPQIASTSEVSPFRKKKEEGRIRYALSDRTFIDKGWTQLPFEKVVRKMNVYRMRPSKPEFDWFEHHKNRVLEYDTGERLAEVEDSGRGRWYYRNGALAMDYYDAEETNVGQRFVVYSSGAPDARGRPRPRTVLATFDHSGNGVVFDHAGKTRLKYNQTEGIVLDQKIGPVSRWKWHTLNDPPVLQKVMIDTQLNHKDPIIAEMDPEDEPKQEDEAMLSIELENSVKDKMKKSSQDYKPFQIKMKALKINENFSLRVLDQAQIYLLYRDGSNKLKINIGMLLDHKEIVDTDAADIGDVSIKVERLPACTASISQLQQMVAHARARDAEERDRRTRLGRLSYIDSIDALRAAISRPRPAALFTCSASATQDTQEKPCFCNLYCKQLS